MAVHVETLEKLERRITLTLPAQEINAEVESRLKKLSRTVKADGFRPGKVPMSVVAQRYGYSVQYEVMNDKVGEAFAQRRQRSQAARRRHAAHHAEGRRARRQIAFDATFEVYPEVKIGDLAGAEVERVAAEVTKPRSTRRSTSCASSAAPSRSARPAEGAAEGDRVTIDFEGKIDGEAFAGGKAEGFQFIIGEGQMLEQFDKAVRGMKVGEIARPSRCSSRPTTTARTWPARKPTSWSR